MKRPLKKLKFKPMTIAALALFVFLLSAIPHPAEAACFSLTGGINLGECVGGVFKFVGYIFNFIGAILFTLAGVIANLMLNLNLNVLDNSNSLIHIGWQIVRDIANLGFVLVIIIIAFATILRFEQYGVSKLLPRLIAAAIIVNFSFAIGAAFINFSNVLTNFFAARALGKRDVSMADKVLPGWDLSASLADAFGPQRFFINTGPQPPTGDEAGGLTEFGTAVLTSIADLIFIVVFTFMGAIVIFALAFMLLIRYLYLTFLMILAPLVWLFWVIPKMESMFHKWWDSFFRWVFFAPASMFFVYLALVSVKTLGRTNLTLLSSSNEFGGVIKNTMIQGTQMVVLAGILIGGLIVAQKMGIYGAAGAMAVAGKVGRGVRGGLASYTQQRAVRTGAAALASRPGQAVAGAVGGALHGVGSRMSAFGANRGRFLRTITAPVRGAGNALVGAARGIAGLTPRAQAVLQRPSPSLLGSVFKGVTGQFGIKQWQCNSCGNVYGPSKKPPPKCTNPVCPVNTAGANQSWKGL